MNQRYVCTISGKKGALVRISRNLYEAIYADKSIRSRTPIHNVSGRLLHPTSALVAESTRARRDLSVENVFYFDFGIGDGFVRAVIPGLHGKVAQLGCPER